MVTFRGVASTRRLLAAVLSVALVIGVMSTGAIASATPAVRAPAPAVSPAPPQPRAATHDAMGQQVATLIYPSVNETGVGAAQPFTWSPVPGAQAYAVAVGIPDFGFDIGVSGILPSTRTSYRFPTFPSDRPLFATLLTEIGGVWGYDEVPFTSATGATFVQPMPADFNVDTTRMVP